MNCGLLGSSGGSLNCDLQPPGGCRGGGSASSTSSTISLSSQSHRSSRSPHSLAPNPARREAGLSQGHPGGLCRESWHCGLIAIHWLTIRRGADASSPRSPPHRTASVGGNPHARCIRAHPPDADPSARVEGWPGTYDGPALPGILRFCDLPLADTRSWVRLSDTVEVDALSTARPPMNPLLLLPNPITSPQDQHTAVGMTPVQ